MSQATNPLSDVSTSALLAEIKRREECARKPEKRIIFFGPPGSGKGTHAPKAKNEYCLCHLSTGDMLRAAVSAGTEMGKQAKAVMDAGGLVSDDIVVGIIKDAVKGDQCQRGFILDGFPRTVEQAKKLDEMLSESKTKIDKVVKFDIADDVLVDRVEGRLVHPSSGRTYHVRNNPPKTPMKDDVTGEDLIHRSDDNPETLKKRLASYHAQTTPVAGYYAQKGLLSNINADTTFESVYTQLKSAVDK